MSKMRSNKWLALALAASVLSGCAHRLSANDPSVRGIGYVRLDDVLKLHPLYPQLAKIDDAIDGLGLKSLGTGAVPRTGPQIASETRELNAQLKQAQDRANEILRQKQIDYAQREQAAIHAALAAAGQGTNGAQPAQAMQNVSAAQARSVTAQANQDFLQYQQGVISQDNAAARAINAQLSARADQSFRQKATQLQEAESQLSLELSQQDAGKRLDLRMKLNNLALPDATRKQYRDDLAAIDKREGAVVTAQRSRDQSVLNTYKKQLQTQMQAQVQAQTSKIHAQTRSKIEARHNQVTRQVASQLQGLQPVAVPSNLPASTREEIAQIDKRFKSQFTAEAQKTVAQYQATKADLDAQYALVQGADSSATGAAGKQLAGLRRERDDLYNKMVEQIKRDAGQVAARRGLQIVFVNVAAASGGIDLTDDVAKDIESLHQ